MARPDPDSLEQQARQALHSAVAEKLDTTGFPLDTMVPQGTPNANELKIVLAQNTVAPSATRPAARQTATDATADVGSPPGMKGPSAASMIGRGPAPDAGARVDRTTASACATVPGLDPALAALLDEEDRCALAQAFPQGVTAGTSEPMALGLRFGARFDIHRVTITRLTPVAAVGRGVEAVIFQVGKGRAILLNAIDHRGVMLDAGVGGIGANQEGVDRLVKAVGAVIASGVAKPDAILISHDHADHTKAAEQVAQLTGAEIQVTEQQIGEAAREEWESISLTAERIRELTIVVRGPGGSVQTHREVIGDMELTELRLIPESGSVDVNSTCPVIVVRDLLDGKRMVFLADSPGKLFTGIVHGLGAEAGRDGEAVLKEILGAAGHNVTTVEGWHHFGKQGGSAERSNAIGALTMLRIVLESGEGPQWLFAQSTEDFAQSSPGPADKEARGKPSFRFVHKMGARPLVFGADPSEGQSQVIVAQGAEMNRVTLDSSGLALDVKALEAPDSALHKGYGLRADVMRLRADVEATRKALEPDEPGPLTESLALTDAELARVQEKVEASLEALWTAAKAAVKAVGGLFGDPDFSTALTRLEAVVEAEKENVAKARNDLKALHELLSLEGRLRVNRQLMLRAVEADDVARLFALRAEHIDMFRTAIAAFGPDMVDDHVRAALAAVEAEWDPTRIKAEPGKEKPPQVVEREKDTDLKARVADSLARKAELLAPQMDLDQVMHSGRSVRNPDGGFTAPKYARAGAGGLGLLEVARIGLEVAREINEGNEGNAKRLQAAGLGGIMTVQWWLQHGVQPVISLLKKSSWRGWNPVFSGDQSLAMQAVGSDTRPPGVPEFDMAVVTGVDPDGLRAMIRRQVAELGSLGDWFTLVSTYPPGPAIAKFEHDWSVMVWDSERERYGYLPVESFAPGVSDELERLTALLEGGQQIKMAAATAAPGAPQPLTVESTFLGGRSVWVYDDHGDAHSIDFGEVRPRFLRQATVDYPLGVQGPLVQVKAVDTTTYRRLAGWYWAVKTDKQYMDGSGATHDVWKYPLNTEGFAYVQEEQLAPAAVQH